MNGGNTISASLTNNKIHRYGMERKWERVSERIKFSHLQTFSSSKYTYKQANKPLTQNVQNEQNETQLTKYNLFKYIITSDGSMLFNGSMSISLVCMALVRWCLYGNRNSRAREQTIYLTEKYKRPFFFWLVLLLLLLIETNSNIHASYTNNWTEIRLCI